MTKAALLDSMVSQLEGSVMTAIALVMIVVLAALGHTRRIAGGFRDPDVVPFVFRLARALEHNDF